MMLRKIYTVGLAVSLSVQAFTAEGANQGYKGDIRTSVNRLEQIGDSLYMDMDVELSDVRVRSRMSIDMTPWLTSPEWSTGMPVVSVKGRRNYRNFKRGIALEKTTMEAAAPNVILKGFGKSDTVLRYSRTIFYEPWMADAVLNMDREASGCGNTRQIALEKIGDNVRLEEAPPRRIAPLVPRMAFVVPEAEAVKKREIRTECRLNFMVNRTEIKPDYMNNPAELARIRGVIDELNNDPSISIVGIEIIGFASPEGSLANNKRLSEGRAMSLMRYLASLYPIPLSDFKVRFGGENWDGLVAALQDNPMEYADEVLAIIQNTEPDQTRKDKIKRLGGGVPYRYMLQNIYPELRTAICSISFVIKGFEPQDALEMFRTNPRNLSLNELYMAARLMEEGSPEFVEVFETAVRLYPDDDIANINAAVASIMERNIAQAQRHLQKVRTRTNLPEFNNAMGAIALFNKDFEKARHYFRQAMEGLDEARINMEKLPVLETNQSPAAVDPDNF